MWIVFYAIFTLVLAAAQTTLLPHVSLWGTVPDLLLVFAVYCGMRLQGNAGVGMGFFTGWIQDSLSGGMLGVNMLSKSLIAFFFSSLKDKIMVEGRMPVMFFILLSSLFDGFMFYAIWTLFLGGGGGGYAIPQILLSAVYSALVGPALFFIFDLKKGWVAGRFPSPALL